MVRPLHRRLADLSEHAKPRHVEGPRSEGPQTGVRKRGFLDWEHSALRGDLPSDPARRETIGGRPASEEPGRGNYDVRYLRDRRRIDVRLSGMITRSLMERFCLEYRAVTSALGGEKHIVIADLRGLKPMSQSVAVILGDTMRWSREHGVCCCAHVSDQPVSGPQAARLARQGKSGDDGVTVECTSLDEAVLVANQKLRELDREINMAEVEAKLRRISLRRFQLP